jgi:serine/threonine protein kinase
VNVFVCPACQRAFQKGGFCPHDGNELAATPASAAAETIISQEMTAQHPTQVEPRRETFPLTPSMPGTPRPPATQDVTAARPKLELPTPPPREIRALSASEDPQAALEMVRAAREQGTEYDRLVGQTLDGRYYVERKIGEGGMGVVFAARHAVIERPLAIKVLKREVMRDTATIKRFVKEAQAASRIGHPNIVDVTDFGTTPDGMTFSVMEYVEGMTLGAALRASAPFSMTRTIRIATQIARALAAAHEKGIVHRDLKPENVFLIERDNRPDFVKIVDFGIAKVTPTAQHAHEPRLTRAGSVFGTPEYMAPEQAAGRSDTDGRVDVYALGVILYEMLTGRVPHKGESMVRTLAMQMLDPMDPPRKARPDLDISPELEAVVMTALAKKRDQRYPTMTDLIAALEKLQTPVGTSLTGSPVYALTPIPPGADPSLIPSAKNLVAPSVEITAPRARTPTSRVKDEPEFVTRDKPITFEHVFTDGGAPAAKRLWPFVLLFVLVLAAGATTIAVVLRSRSHGTEPLRDAGAVALAADAAPPATDAIAIVPADALDIVVVVDAGRTVVRVTRDAGRAADAAITTPNGRGTISIQVITKPEDATLYNGTTYAGPGGTNIEMPFGAKAELTCKKTGYKPGKVQLVFDGSQEIALCALQRVKICIDNIKNPFDDCEIDPTKPVPPSPIDQPLDHPVDHPVEPVLKP